MNILFVLLGFSHQSAQCINTYCNTSDLSPWFCLAGRRNFWTLLHSIISVLKNVTAALACAPLLVSFTDSWLLPDTEGLYSVGETQCSRAHSVSLVPGEWMSLPSGMVRAAPLSAAELNPAPAHRVAASCHRPSAAALSKLSLVSQGIWRAAKSHYFPLAVFIVFLKWRYILCRSGHTLNFVLFLAA